MGILGSAIGDAVSAGLGTYQGTSLQGFLSKFNNSDSNYVDTLDPLNSFDCRLEFFPRKEPEAQQTGFGAAMNSLLKSASNAAYNAINIGGLASLFKDDPDVLKCHDNFENTADGKTSHSFMEYLASACLMQQESPWGSGGGKICPLILDMGYYVQKVTVPNITMPLGEQSNTMLGNFPSNGYFVQPESNNITMDILNTKLPIIERIMYPWLREVTLPFWSYEDQPYTTANIILDFRKHCDIQYRFTGCRPSSIQTYQPSQETPSSLSRQVSFTFDFMFVESKELKARPSAMSKLLGAASKLGGMAGGMLGGL